MSMTREEYGTKVFVEKHLAEQGYPTYAEILDEFDLHLTNDPGVIGYMEPENGSITLNRKLDLGSVSVIIRHEILHFYLEHEKRLLTKLANERNLDYDKLDDLTLKEIKQELYGDPNSSFNIAADYEISNRGYTEADKRRVRAIEMNGEVLKGLVTEDDHPDWVDMSVEEMYDELRKQLQKDQKTSKDSMKKNNSEQNKEQQDDKNQKDNDQDNNTQQSQQQSSQGQEQNKDKTDDKSKNKSSANAKNKNNVTYVYGTFDGTNFYDKNGQIIIPN